MTFDKLNGFRDDSGTGPDECPARILKMCAKELALPLTMLITRILACMEWPESWREHWVIPIFKKNVSFKPGNYRGVHLTAQPSKVCERLIKKMLQPYLERTLSFEINQFAYREKRGARDVLALLMLDWILVLNRRGKVCFYCSDVSGAFDRVNSGIPAKKVPSEGCKSETCNIIDFMVPG